MNKKSLEELLRNIALVGNKNISSLMTKISEVTFLDTNENRESLRDKIRKSKRTFYPVCEGFKENVIGIIHIKDILISSLSESKIDLREGMHEPVYFNENFSVHQVYDIFFQSNIGAAFVVNKENNISGFITLKDITKTFLGNLKLEEDLTEPFFVQRHDGTWLAEGLTPITEFKKSFDLKALPDEDKKSYHTLSGFIMDYLGKVPKVTDSFVFGDYSFEVMDMDSNRVDKILIKKLN